MPDIFQAAVLLFFKQIAINFMMHTFLKLLQRTK